MELSWRRLVRLRRMGILNAIRWGLVHAEGLGWDRYFGVETGRLAVEGSTAVPPESIPYEPLPWFLVRRAIRALAPSREDVFLDYGAGLGRALLMAASHRMKRVVGVELLAPLARSARRNISTARHRLRTPVDIFSSDAAAWDVPDDVTVVYLFNPFVGAVMKAVQARLRGSLERRPRGLRVLYAHADDQPDLFACCDWLQPTHRVGTGVFRGMNVTIYDNGLTRSA